MSVTVIDESQNNRAEARKELLLLPHLLVVFFVSLCSINKPIELLKVTCQEINVYFPREGIY